jgi:hypothetical protein
MVRGSPGRFLPQRRRNPGRSKKAYFILQRDLTRVCEYFAKQGLVHNPEAILSDMWQRYLVSNEENRVADESRLMEEAMEE